MTRSTADTDFDHVECRPGAYADSVALLQVSKDVAAVDGVRAAQVAMATPLNLDVIASMGFDLPETSPNDMVVALRLESESHLDSALAAVDAALVAVTRRTESAGSVEEPPRTIASAIKRSEAAMGLVSVPGANAVVEAMDALDAGHDVMVFSDNVPVAQEIALKQVAAERDLLVMGPDCGTAMVDGVGLGFANTVQPGPVGLVAASGTGCQQLMCLLDHAGVGMTAALGVGGRDLSVDVGAMATRQAMRRLDADPATELIVVVSKPPAAQVASELRDFAKTLGTPVHFALLGAGQPDLTASAEEILQTLGRPVPQWPTWGASAATVSPGRLRGLFAGGTLCDEAMIMATDQLGPVHSNIPLDPQYALDSTLTADGTVMIDFGDDTMTAGRPHPMIDPTIRLEYLARTAADPATSAVLMDVVLGHGADADPAATTAPAIRAAIAAARDDGRELAVLVACVGTASDPQVLDDQAAALADAGAEVFLSNARAAGRAISLIGATA
ncbi:FdrA family protein [Janibacter cremeus]|uniref:FdrA protein n=1 Tax=Janibacter cremeus TaxID=1285192 RepID=A0A852VWM5_9MICO|nr:FdrA family protein [Janibacter cremeus]NYF97931.1 FdrA protein [Janibacter cremeus]